MSPSDPKDAEVHAPRHVSSLIHLETLSLSKVYRNGVVALDGIDLQVFRGDFFGLIGCNGAGKSTFVGSVTGLIKPTTGAILFNGIELSDSSWQTKSSLGVVPQELNLNVFERPLNILLNQAGYFGISRRVASERAEQLLMELGLWEKRHSEVRTLSGGMKRRLMIARALVHRPDFLLLDEPTAGLDVDLRHTTWDYLRKLNAEGVTIVLTSHYLEEIEQLCSRAAMIQQGKILRQDTLVNLLKSLEEQVYIVRTTHPFPLNSLPDYPSTKISADSWEVVLSAQDTLTQYIIALYNHGIEVKEVHLKRSRLEQLFLNVRHERR